MKKTAARGLGAVLALSLLAACGGAQPTSALRPPERPDPAMQPVPNAAYDAWVANFRPRATAAGIAPGVFDAAFASTGFLPGVIESDRDQPEFRRTLGQYLAGAVTDTRINTGRAMLARYDGVLDQIEARYGVDREVVVAIWGLESSYGDRRGNIPTVSALSTLAFEGRRGAFMEEQLIAALRIIQNGDVDAQHMLGSWAGAMGHTQFIPTSYLAYAADFNGDGKRDIWSDDPTDSLASTARYLANAGWTRGQLWGVEVSAPGVAASDTRRSVADWQAAGVRAARGSIPDHGPARLIRPEGADGPAFLAFGNWSSIARYNNAASYVIAVGHLSDRLKGGAPFATPMAGYHQLTEAQRKDLQRGLARAGFYDGEIDGLLGAGSTTAIRAYQQAAGLPVDGFPSEALLARLR
ncbi:lytic murein transglycosylase [Pseudoroseicyclus aestuarii]|uniref:lytic murein transglycosylase n=1 Tax=Pseudoroseicyclus aestuarii TaxID=1795041 RepID=UPI003CCC7F69